MTSAAFEFICIAVAIYGVCRAAIYVANNSARLLRELHHAVNGRPETINVMGKP